LAKPEAGQRRRYTRASLGNGRPGSKCLRPENAMVVKFCEVVKPDFDLFIA